MWCLNIFCGCLIIFSDLVFTGGRKITDGRERCCGCNLDEQEDIKQALKQLLCIRTAAALALVCPNAHRDVIGVSSSPGINRRVFPSTYMSPGSCQK